MNATKKGKKPSGIPISQESLLYCYHLASIAGKSSCLSSLNCYKTMLFFKGNIFPLDKSPILWYLDK